MFALLDAFYESYTSSVSLRLPPSPTGEGKYIRNFAETKRFPRLRALFVGEAICLPPPSVENGVHP